MVNHWIMMDGLMQLTFQPNLARKNHGTHVSGDENGYDQAACHQTFVFTYYSVSSFSNTRYEREDTMH